MVDKKSDNKKKLLDKLMEAKIGKMLLLSESDHLKRELVTTELPILNIAFSGEVDGGLISGLTMLAGESKCFKSLLGLYCMKAYLDKFPDAYALFYDSEFGITNEYLQILGIDTSRVIHIPVENVEQLKFDLVKKLEIIDPSTDKIFIFIDSLGALASKKEIEDAVDEKSVLDMSRAKAIKSLVRIITPSLTSKDIPCFVVNHVYQEIGMYPKTIMSGGNSTTYHSNQAFIIKKSPIKDGREIVGNQFTIFIEKSRYVKEKSQLAFTIMWDSGIDKYSGIFDLAIEAGFILKSGGWYQIVDTVTGEVEEKKLRGDAIPEDYYEKLLVCDEFKSFVKNKFKIQ